MTSQVDFIPPNSSNQHPGAEDMIDFGVGVCVTFCDLMYLWFFDFGKWCKPLLQSFCTLTYNHMGNWSEVLYFTHFQRHDWQKLRCTSTFLLNEHQNQVNKAWNKHKQNHTVHMPFPSIYAFPVGPYTVCVCVCVSIVLEIGSGRKTPPLYFSPRRPEWQCHHRGAVHRGKWHKHLCINT